MGESIGSTPSCGGQGSAAVRLGRAPGLQTSRFWFVLGAARTAARERWCRCDHTHRPSRLARDCRSRHASPGHRYAPARREPLIAGACAAVGARSIARRRALRASPSAVALIRRLRAPPGCVWQPSSAPGQSRDDAPFGPRLRPSRSFGASALHQGACGSRRRRPVNRATTRPSGLAFGRRAHSHCTRPVQAVARISAPNAIRYHTKGMKS